MHRLLFAILLAGCNPLFGIDETVLVDEIVDLGMVSGVYSVRWPQNAVDGAPEIHNEFYPFEEIEGEVELADGTTRDVTFGPDGAFSFPTATVGQRYSLTIRTTNAQLTLQLDAPTLRFVERLSGRGDRVIAPANTKVVFNVTGRPVLTPTATEHVVSTGIWTSSLVTAPGATPGAIEVDWTLVKTAVGAIGLLDGTRFDDMFYVHYDTDGTYTRALRAARAPQTTLVGGQKTTIAATAAVIAKDMCTRIAVHSAQEIARLSAEVDNEVGALAVWGIEAVPSFEHSRIAHHPLAYPLGSVADADVAADITYGSPFPGGVITASYGAVVYRPESGTITSGVGIPAATTCNTTSTLSAGLTQVPTTAQLAGVELVTDMQVVSIDRRTHIPVSWQVSSTGTTDYATVALVELPISGGSIVQQIVVTTGTQVMLDPANFTSGGTYLLVIENHLDYPNAGTGDFETMRPMVGAGGLQTPVFRVE